MAAVEKVLIHNTELGVEKNITPNAAASAVRHGWEYGPLGSAPEAEATVEVHTVDGQTVTVPAGELTAAAIEADAASVTTTDTVPSRPARPARSGITTTPQEGTA